MDKQLYLHLLVSRPLHIFLSPSPPFSSSPQTFQLESTLWSVMQQKQQAEAQVEEMRVCIGLLQQQLRMATAKQAAECGAGGAQGAAQNREQERSKGGGEEPAGGKRAAEVSMHQEQLQMLLLLQEQQKHEQEWFQLQQQLEQQHLWDPEDEQRRQLAARKQQPSHQMQQQLQLREREHAAEQEDERGAMQQPQQQQSPQQQQFLRQVWQHLSSPSTSSSDASRRLSKARRRRTVSGTIDFIPPPSLILRPDSASPSPHHLLRHPFILETTDSPLQGPVDAADVDGNAGDRAQFLRLPAAADISTAEYAHGQQAGNITNSSDGKEAGSGSGCGGSRRSVLSAPAELDLFGLVDAQASPVDMTLSPFEMQSMMLLPTLGAGQGETRHAHSRVQGTSEDPNSQGQQHFQQVVLAQQRQGSPQTPPLYPSPPRQPRCLPSSQTTPARPVSELEAWTGGCVLFELESFAR